MNDLTKIGLMDSCIDGDRDKFDQLFGSMYDQFSCFFSLLRENGIYQIPKQIAFTENMKVAEFDIGAKVSLEQREETQGVFDCRISVTPSKQTTKIKIQARK